MIIFMTGKRCKKYIREKNVIITKTIKGKVSHKYTFVISIVTNTVTLGESYGQ